MGRIHYPAGYPVAGYPVSGGKIGRIPGYRFCKNIKLSEVKGKYAKLFLVKIFINFKFFPENLIKFNKIKLVLFNLGNSN